MIIEIYTHDKYDIESKNIEKMFYRFSSKNISIKMTKLYKIKECENNIDIKKVAEDILIDPIVEGYLLRKENSFVNGYKGFIDVFLKDSITDVVGESVGDIIKRVTGKSFRVRTGRSFYFSGSKDLFIDFIKEEFFNELIHKINVREL